MENDELDYDAFDVEDQELEHDMEEFDAICRETGDF
jgi:hypothetical protein